MRSLPCAVLVDQTTNTTLFFGCHVPSIWVDRWRVTGKEQVTCEAELLPVFVATATWPQKLCKRRDIRFIDNDAARFSLI